MKIKFLFILTIFFLFQACRAEGPGKRIMVNQVGYYPVSTKIALVPDCGSKGFIVRSETTGNIVFEGVLEAAGYWEYSGDRVHVADFSALMETGSFIVMVDDERVADSYPFRISDSVYREAGQSVLHAFYLQRASMEIKEEFAGKYHRPAGHPDTVVFIHSSAATTSRPENTIISSPGGWYDAGDNNKYVVNSGITTFTLLELFELTNSMGVDLKLNIPEKNNDLPDLLDEILWNLRWMMTMQDPNDGGAYHKLTHKKFQPFIMPHEVVAPRYVVMKTTSATLDLAAVCAKAERIFRPYDDIVPGLADSLLHIAKYAWQWALANPDISYSQPDDIKTGAYAGSSLDDEWAWASLELFFSTGDLQYLRGDLENDLLYDVPEWGQVGTLGIYSMLNDNANQIESYEAIRKKFLETADALHEKYLSSAYRVSLDTFPWGSNSEAMNQGILLLKAFLTTGEQGYLEVAEAAVHYVLGRNPLNYCFLTGAGTKYPVDLHDRRSQADGIGGAIPGLMAGGPSRQALQDCGMDTYPSTFPALSYVDRKCSYSTNEWAINWNAACAMLVNSLEAIRSCHSRDY